MANLWELFKYHTARTGEERWDADRWCNADALKRHQRTLRWATRLGFTELADRAEAEITEGQFMADRAERCPNNPRNGGRGYDEGDGTWVDRRGPEWVSVEDHFAGTDVLDRIDLGGIPDVGQDAGWFASRRAARELGWAFGQLDIYMAEVRDTDRDYPELFPHIIDRIDRLVETAPLSAIDEHIGFYDDEFPATTRQEYIDAWQQCKDDLVDRMVEERLDEIDPLTNEDVEREYDASYERDDDDTDAGTSEHEPEIDRDQLGGWARDSYLATIDPLTPDTREAALDELEAAADAGLFEFEQVPYEPERELGCLFEPDYVTPPRDEEMIARIRYAVETGKRWAEVSGLELADIERATSEPREAALDELEVAIDNGLERGEPEQELPDGERQDKVIAAAREWISDCTWSDLDPERLAELSDDEILKGVERHYDGGLEAFEESVYFGNDEPAQPPYPTDEDGFPTVHATYQAHTLPDDTYSWGCAKADCHTGLPEYTTKAEALAAAREHEQQHGYEPDLPERGFTEPESELAADEPAVDEQPADLSERDILTTHNGPVNPAAKDELQATLADHDIPTTTEAPGCRLVDAQDLLPGQRILVGPGDVQTVTERTERDQYNGCSIFTDRSEILTGLPCPVKVLDDDAELAVTPTNVNAPELVVDDAEIGVDPAEPAALEVAEPELAADEVELDGPGDAPANTLEDTAEPAVEQEQPASEVALDVAGPELDAATEQDIADAANGYPGEPGTGLNRSYTADRVEKAKQWIKALRSGRHRQAFGTWNEPGVLGRDKECTVEVGKNELGMSLEQMKDTFGHRLVNKTVTRNDRGHRSFPEQADFLQQALIPKDQHLELEAER